MQVGVGAGLQEAEARSPDPHQQLTLLQQQSSHLMNLMMLMAMRHCSKVQAMPRETVRSKTCWSSCLLLQGWQRSSSSSSRQTCLLMLRQASGHHQGYLMLPCQVTLHLHQASDCTCLLAKV